MRVSSILLMSLLPNKINSFIMNSAAPVCRNCKFYKKNSIFDLDKCTKFGTKDVVQGNIVYDYADLCRKYDDKCGKNGVYFEPKALHP